MTVEVEEKGFEDKIKSTKIHSNFVTLLTFAWVSARRRGQQLRQQLGVSFVLFAEKIELLLLVVELGLYLDVFLLELDAILDEADVLQRFEIETLLDQPIRQIWQKRLEEFEETTSVDRE